MRRMILVLAIGVHMCGCVHKQTQITALPASRFNCNEPPGMPFYLPKPLLIVSKNVRHIDEAKVGLTEPAPIPNAFDDQASYADIKANVMTPGSGSAQLQAAGTTGDIKHPEKFDTVVPGLPADWRGKMTPAGRIEDGLAPDSFYTYQIVFIPDLSQKYGLTISGKPGEVRAAMNMVNGWMYTGMGPFYMKDSSQAQNSMAAGVASMYAGRGVADVLDSVSGLAGASLTKSGAGQAERAALDSDAFVDRVAELARIVQSQTLVPSEMLNYAEISVYEPQLREDGGMAWIPIAQHSMSRHYFSPDMDPASAKVLKDLIGALTSETIGQGIGEQVHSDELPPQNPGSQGASSPSPGEGSTLPGSSPGSGAPSGQDPNRPGAQGAVENPVPVPADGHNGVPLPPALHLDDR